MAINSYTEQKNNVEKIEKLIINKLRLQKIYYVKKIKNIPFTNSGKIKYSKLND